MLIRSRSDDDDGDDDDDDDAMSQRAEGSGCSQSREAPHTETEDRLRHGESAHLTHTARRPSTLLGLISPAGSVLWSSHFITVCVCETNYSMRVPRCARPFLILILMGVSLIYMM